MVPPSTLTLPREAKTPPPLSGRLPSVLFARRITLLRRIAPLPMVSVLLSSTASPSLPRTATSDPPPPSPSVAMPVAPFLQPPSMTMFLRVSLPLLVTCTRSPLYRPSRMIILPPRSQVSVVPLTWSAPVTQMISESSLSISSLARSKVFTGSASVPGFASSPVLPLTHTLSPGCNSSAYDACGNAANTAAITKHNARTNRFNARIMTPFKTLF